MRDAIYQAASGEVVRGEVNNIGPNGRVHYVDFSIKPVLDEEGKVIFLVPEGRDITEYKKMYETLRESEGRLREAQQLVNLGYWFWDVHSGDVEWSDEIYKIFRLDPEEFTPHIDSIQALSPWPEDHQRDKELIQRAIESREQGSYEQRFLRPDGSTGYFISTFQGIYDDDGALTAIKGAVQDISERKQAEEKQRALEANYQTIFNSGYDAIVVHDMETGAILDVNKRMCEMFGYTHDEALNLTVEEISLGEEPYSQKEAAEWIHKAVTQGPQTFEWICKNKNGETFWVEVTLKRVTIAGQDRVLATDRDITDRKQVEEALRESEQRLRAIFEQAAVGVAQIVSKTGEFVRINQKYCDIVGYSREEMMGRTFQEITHPEDLQPDLENMKELLAGRIRSFSMENRYIRKEWFHCMG